MKRNTYFTGFLQTVLFLITATVILSFASCGGGGGGGGGSGTTTPTPTPTPTTSDKISDYKLIYDSGNKYRSDPVRKFSPAQKTIPTNAKASYTITLKDATGVDLTTDEGIEVDQTNGDINIKSVDKFGVYKITVTATPALDSGFTGTLKSNEFTLTVKDKDIANGSSLSYTPIDLSVGVPHVFNVMKSFPADVSIDYSLSISVDNNANTNDITIDASGNIKVDATVDSNSNASPLPGIYTVTVTATPKPDSIRYGGEIIKKFSFQITTESLIYKPGTSTAEKSLFTIGDIDNPFLFQARTIKGANTKQVDGTIKITGGTNEITAKLNDHTAVFESDGVYVHGIGIDMTADLFKSIMGKAIEINVDVSIDGNKFIIGNATNIPPLSVKGAPANEIYNWRDLQNMKYDLTQKYKLINDIVFPAKDIYGNPDKFTPVGDLTNNFTGDFDGNGKTISNIKIDSTTDNAGIIGYAVGTENTPLNIKNVTIEQTGVTGKNNLGILAGYGKYLNISGVTVKNTSGAGKVSGDDNVGGLIGTLESSTVSNSISTVDVAGKSSIGGLIGTAALILAGDKLTVTGSSATGMVSSTSTNGDVIVGGLIGDLKGITASDKAVLLNSFAVGKVSAISTNSSTTGGIGGLVGRIDFADISGDSGKTYASGDVSADSSIYVGGMAGYLKDSTVENPTANGQVTGSNQTGGIAGYLKDSSVDNPTANGQVTGKDQTGGIAGYVMNSSVVNATSNGQVTGSNQTGGIAGYVMNSSVVNATTNEQVTGKDQTGGMAGYIENSSVTNTTANKQVTGTNQTGGIAGYVTNSPILKSTANGSVTGNNQTGGLAGYIKNSAILNATAKGPVTGKNQTGGLIGYVSDSTVDTGIASGDVSGDNEIGGLIGIADITTDGSRMVVTGSSATGKVTSKHTTGIAVVGGLIGNLKGKDAVNRAVLKNSFAEGKVSANSTDSSTDGGIGGLAGRIQFTDISGDTDKTYASGDVNAEGSNNVGGMAGYLKDSSVINTTAKGTVRGKEYVGGLVGRIFDSTVDTGKANGDVTGDHIVGGLIGAASIIDPSSDLVVTGSNATGNVTATTANNAIVGGLIGFFYGNIHKKALLINNFATGNVTTEADGTNYNGGAGGLVGRITDAKSSGDFGKTYASGDVIAKKSRIVGGLMGYYLRTNVINAIAKGNKVEGRDWVGGLIGSGVSQTIVGIPPIVSSVTNCEATANVTGTGTYRGGNVGGLIGYAANLNIENSRATGEVTGVLNVGGLIGKFTTEENETKKSQITNSFATGSVTADGTKDSKVGGLVGYFTRDTTKLDGKITDSYYNGTITTNKDGTSGGTGGLVGVADFVDITGEFGKTYSKGDVTATDAGNVGGLVGYFNGLNIKKAYSKTTVIGNNNVGGLLGRNSSGSLPSKPKAPNTVETSYHIGNVEVKFKSLPVGGIIGSSDNTTLTAVYSVGDVNGGSPAGGIAGQLSGTANTYILKGYAVGNIKGQSQVGGLTGHAQNNGNGIGYFRGNVTDINLDTLPGDYFDFIVGQKEGSGNYKAYYKTTVSKPSALSGYAGTEISLDNNINICNANNFYDINIKSATNASIGNFVCVKEGAWPAVYMGETKVDGFSLESQPTGKIINGKTYPF